MKIGILGDGQLARMLIAQGQQMGFEMHVLALNKKAPAAQVTRHVTLGKTKDINSLKKLLKVVDVATFESEFLDPELLSRATRQTQTRIQPRPQLMGLLQDRLTQKKLLQKSKIPTAPYLIIDHPRDLQKALKKFPTGFVIKTRRFGYDGYGTFVVKKSTDIKAHLAHLPRTKLNCIAEEFIPFKRELAASLVFNGKQIRELPLVESFQENSRCLWVKGPTRHSAWPKLRLRLSQMLKRLDYRGIMAFEMFDTGRGLLVNEIAPRVHNSAHYSMDALDHDQFEMHLRAITGARLPKPKAKTKGYAMWNLLGSNRKTPRLSKPRSVHLHWYGKEENRPGRKMGHLNGTAGTPDKALAKVRRARKDINL